MEVLPRLRELLLGSGAALPADRDGGVFWVRGVEQWEAQEEARFREQEALLCALGPVLNPSPSGAWSHHEGPREAGTSSGTETKAHSKNSTEGNPEDGANPRPQTGTSSVSSDCKKSGAQTPGGGASLAAELEESVAWYRSELVALRRCLLSLEIHNASQERALVHAHTRSDFAIPHHRSWRAGPTAAVAMLGAAGTAAAGALATLGTPLTAPAPAVASVRATHSGEEASRGGHQETARRGSAPLALAGSTSSEQRYAQLRPSCRREAGNPPLLCPRLLPLARCSWMLGTEWGRLQHPMPPGSTLLTRCSRSRHGMTGTAKNTG